MFRERKGLHQGHTVSVSKAKSATSAQGFLNPNSSSFIPWRGRNKGHPLRRAGDKGSEKARPSEALAAIRQGVQGRAEGRSLLRKTAVTRMEKTCLLSAGCASSMRTVSQLFIAEIC